MMSKLPPWFWAGWGWPGARIWQDGKFLVARPSAIGLRYHGEDVREAAEWLIANA